MATAYDLYENCETVISLIREEGFTKALLFKGFVEDEEKTLNIVVYDKPSSSEILPPRPRRIYSLLKKLTDLLRCNIDLCSHEHVEPWCLEKEALLITLFDDHASTKADPVTLDEQFANHFGSDWQKWEFNSTFNEYLLPCNKQEESGSVEKDPVEEVTNENDVSSSFKRLCCR